jgi:hypothetical protein
VTNVHEIWTADDMLELGRRHARIETARDLEGTMATLVAEPVYELWPLGRRMHGQEQVRRYYRHLFDDFMPRARGVTLVSEWVSEASVAQEYAISVDVDGVLESHRVVGILYAEGSLLGGERVYASERLLRLMAGDALIDELASI